MLARLGRVDMQLLGLVRPIGLTRADFSGGAGECRTRDGQISRCATAEEHHGSVRRTNDTTASR